LNLSVNFDKFKYESFNKGLQSLAHSNRKVFCRYYCHNRVEMGEKEILSLECLDYLQKKHWPLDNSDLKKKVKQFITLSVK